MSRDPRSLRPPPLWLAALSAALLLLLLALPASRAAQPSASPPALSEPAAARVNGFAVRQDEPLRRRLELPEIGQRAQGFALLPGEDAAVSRSLGSVTDGALYQAHTLRFPHPRLALLERQSRRDLNHTTDAMAALIDSAAAHVQRDFPGAITYLGNFSALGGGDIPYSVSHNSGRDADLAFFVLDEVSGAPYEMDDLIALDEQGRYQSEEGDLTLRFDVARNWALIEGLMIAGEDGTLQYVFVSEPLKAMLLEYARGIGARSDLIAAADRLLLQPRSALPHNDHFHLRIYCAEVDVASGCTDRGVKRAGYNAYASARAQAVERAEGLLRDGLSEEHGVNPELVIAAIERAQRLGERSLSPLIKAHLEHDSARVRAAAARALSALNASGEALSDRLDEEDHPRVIAELIVALGERGDRASVAALAQGLTEPRPLHGFGSGGEALDARALILDQLATSERAEAVEPIVAMLESLDPQRHVALARRAERALAHLTNQDASALTASGDPAHGVAASAIAWRAWFEGRGKQRRSAWLLEGFKQAGFEIKALNKASVWALCRAIESERDELSYNAQRELMRLFKHRPLSLQWSKQDASFYWRRWLERRARALRLPRIPEAMSTLKNP